MSTNFFVDVDGKNESSEKRVSRFKQWFGRSRIQNMVRDGRYRTKAKTKREQRDAALKREEYRDDRERKKYYQ